MDDSAKLLHWLARYHADDSVLALHMLAVTGAEYPELAELGDHILRIGYLLGITQLRLAGAEIYPVGDSYICYPLPDF